MGGWLQLQDSSRRFFVAPRIHPPLQRLLGINLGRGLEKKSEGVGAFAWLPNDIDCMNRSDRFRLSKQGEPKQPESATLPPPIVGLLEDVEMFDQLIREGEIANQSPLARKLEFTRARIT